MATRTGAGNFAEVAPFLNCAGKSCTNINVYRREAGAWKIVHHLTDLSPVMMDVLARLQAKG
jgi:hypothetical protein